jgi:hypothetical protein
MRTGIWIAIQEARQMNDEARHLAQGFSPAHESEPVPLLEAKGIRWGLFLSVESSATSAFRLSTNLSRASGSM